MDSVRAHLQKIPRFPYLYRHDTSDIYYGIKRAVIGGEKKTKQESLKTTDRKLAERKLKEWLQELEAPEKKSVTTFEGLFSKFVELQAGKEESTKNSYAWVLKKFQTNGGQKLLSTPVDSLKASDLSIFFARFEKKFAPTTYNSFTLIVKQVLDVAVMDGLLKGNPYHLLPNRRMKNCPEPDEVPTIEECEKLVENIRTQKYSATREDAADLCQFLHCAAIGEAEARWLTWGKIDFQKQVMEVKRQKTGVYFTVPFYPSLKPLLEKLLAKAKQPSPETPVFKLLTIKQALYNACERLKMPRYSPRDLRKARIVWMLRRGLTVEQIAKWQGHRDNGVLIRRTYAWVIDADQRAFESQQLDKLK